MTQVPKKESYRLTVSVPATFQGEGEWRPNHGEAPVASGQGDPADV